MPDEVKLLPCPLCASEQVTTAPDREFGDVTWDVICKACGVRVSRDLEEHAIAAWNIRPPADEVVERVLSDPTAVHLNMLRGGIAKPSVANIWHLYGEKALLAEAPDHIRAAIAAWNTRAIEATRPTDTTDFER